MLAWVLVVLGLGVGVATAADIGELSTPSTETALLQETPLGGEEDPELAARMAALEAAQAQFAAKVVVLEWAGSGVDYENGTVQRNIRSRIARPDAKFYPEIDLYQAGRREPDRSIAPGDQRGTVPDTAISSVMAAVADIETVPWDQMTEADWGITCNNLRAIAEDIWFVDRVELREPMFQLYVQIGRSAENMNNPVAPFYQHIGGQLMNYYWYLAAVLAFEDAELLSTVSDQGIYSSLTYYKEMLEARQLTFMTLSFEQAGVFDMKKFASDYQVFINGLEILITDPQSLYSVPPGRVDVYMKRSDAHSISDRIELDKLDEKIYFVRDVARKRMGVDFIDQLMKHPNECTPRVDGDILTYLAIWATLHPEAEIYIAVPVAGNPNKILLWRWNREAKTLTKVLDETGGYPIRFALLGGMGMAFNGANVTQGECTQETPDAPPVCEPPMPEFAVAGMPFWLQLRGHYGRLMIGFGGEANLTLAEEFAPWSDEFQTQGRTSYDSAGNPILKEVLWSRLLYTNIGVVFMKNAANGFGPRGYVRFGWFNVPHMLDLTLHGGLTLQPIKEQEGRVRMMLDFDGYLGTMIPFEMTNRNDDPDSPSVIPSFGVLIGFGITF